MIITFSPTPAEQTDTRFKKSVANKKIKADPSTNSDASAVFLHGVYVTSSPQKEH